MLLFGARKIAALGDPYVQGICNDARFRRNYSLCTTVAVERLPALLQAIVICHADILNAWNIERRLEHDLGGDGSSDPGGYQRESLVPSRVVAAVAELGLQCAAADAKRFAGTYSAFLRSIAEAVVVGHPLASEVASSALVAVASARPTTLARHLFGLVRDLATNVTCIRAASAMCAVLVRIANAVESLVVDAIGSIPWEHAGSSSWRCQRAALMCRALAPLLRRSADSGSVAAARNVVNLLANTAVRLCDGACVARSRAVSCGMDLAAALAGLFDRERREMECVVKREIASSLFAVACRVLRNLTCKPVCGSGIVAVRYTCVVVLRSRHRMDGMQWMSPG